MAAASASAAVRKAASAVAPAETASAVGKTAAGTQIGIAMREIVGVTKVCVPVCKVVSTPAQVVVAAGIVAVGQIPAMGSPQTSVAVRLSMAGMQTSLSRLSRAVVQPFFDRSCRRPPHAVRIMLSESPR